MYQLFATYVYFSSRTTLKFAVVARTETPKRLYFLKAFSLKCDQIEFGVCLSAFLLPASFNDDVESTQMENKIMIYTGICLAEFHLLIFIVVAIGRDGRFWRILMPGLYSTSKWGAGFLIKLLFQLYVTHIIFPI